MYQYVSVVPPGAGFFKEFAKLPFHTQMAERHVK